MTKENNKKREAAANVILKKLQDNARSATAFFISNGAHTNLLFAKGFADKLRKSIEKIDLNEKIPNLKKKSSPLQP